MEGNFVTKTVTWKEHWLSLPGIIPKMLWLCAKEEKGRSDGSNYAIYERKKLYFLIALDPGLEYDRDIEWTYRYSETAVIAWSENSVIVIDRSRHRAKKKKW